MTFTISGDSEHLYVSDTTGRIVATCGNLEDATRVAAALNLHGQAAGGSESRIATGQPVGGERSTPPASPGAEEVES